ncbi:MAG: hypothetical protein WB869_09530 [Candidatus Acidiferrales bacterium]
MSPSDSTIALTTAQPPRMRLEASDAEIRLTSLTPGIDNIHYDVYLSPRFVEAARKYIRALVRQIANVNVLKNVNKKSSGPPEHSAFKKILTDLLEASLTHAKYTQNIEADLLNRLAVLGFLTAVLSDEFSSLLVECKEWIRSRGELFEHSEQAHVMRSKIAGLQTDRKGIFRQIGEILYNVSKDIEENVLSKSRRALFGDDFSSTYALLTNRFLFVENGNDDYLFLEQYVLLGNFIHDPDRFDVFEGLFIDFVRDFVMGDEGASEELNKARKNYERLAEQARSMRFEMTQVDDEVDEHQRKTARRDESFPWPWRRKGNASANAEPVPEVAAARQRQVALESTLEEFGGQLDAAKQRMEFLAAEYRSHLGDFLNDPENARRLLDASAPGSEVEGAVEARRHLLQEWLNRLEEHDLLIHILASYEVKNIYRGYCPPVHLQQLKKALVNREEAKRVEQVLEQFPARKLSMKRLEDSAKAIRRMPPEETRAAALRFAQDFMRLRRDRRHYHQVTTWIERINLVKSEQTRQLSRVNNTLYELLFSDEETRKEDPIISHAVIKTDVRGSTGITKELLARGLNPASHFSLILHEPVKRLIGRYGAAKVFIEGDAIILAIYETESTRSSQRAVAKACILAREILSVVQTYNDRAAAGDLPRLELGVGIAFQDSAPAVWMDGDSKVMISRALNLSDRLSSCSKMARRIIEENASPFNVFLLQSLMEDAGDDGEELMVRYNLNGIELNEEGFQKLTKEISLAPMSGNFPMPWGKQRVELFFGEVPLGGSFEPLIIRKGIVRQLLPGGKIGEPGNRAYYEVCTHPKLLELARRKIIETVTATQE